MKKTIRDLNLIPRIGVFEKKYLQLQIIHQYYLENKENRYKALIKELEIAEKRDLY